MRRRTLLSACVGAIGGITGCTTRRRGRGGDETPTPDPQVEVSLDRYQPAVVSLFVDAIALYDGGSYLYLRVDATDADDPPAPEEFVFRAGETRTGPILEQTGTPQLYRSLSGDDAYGADGSEVGRLPFELPESAAGDPRVVWPGDERGEWRPDDRLRERMTTATPPTSMTFSAPETVRAGESPTLSMTVDNEGDLPARFVAALNRKGPDVAVGPVEPVSTPVDPSETETWHYEDDSINWDLAREVSDDGDLDLTYRLYSVDGRRERRVQVVDG